eukprot:jgi/Mesen1/3807/ME000206S02992
MEALEESVYARQRQYLLTFLLRQVPVSRNFSTLSGKKARQIAFGIIRRSFSLQPPSPPMGCAHIWGPPLVATMSDMSLHLSLRQPAIELACALITADVAVTVTLHLAASSSCHLSQGSNLFSRSMAARESTDAASSDVIGQLVSLGLDREPPSAPAQGQYQQGASESASLVRRQLDEVAELAAAETATWHSVPALWVELVEQVPLEMHTPPMVRVLLWAAGQLALVDDVAPGGSLTATSAHAPGLDMAAALTWASTSSSDEEGGASSVNALLGKSHRLELTSLFRR